MLDAQIVEKRYVKGIAVEIAIASKQPFPNFTPSPQGIYDQ